MLILLASPKETNKAKNIQGSEIKIWKEKKIKTIKERMKRVDGERDTATAEAANHSERV